MKSFEKFLKVMSANLGTTIVLIAAIILFAIFSDGLLSGIITAFSALVAYACGINLYREFSKDTQKKASKKK
ncbi:MAG: hypothetical protein MJ170_03810 [Alphaproteobacteria bacterium]|nr:hypothetical protein [Alphaproteobacteria bacterium]